MASSKCTLSNSSSDISHVLDSLGSLIGELNAINVDKVSKLLNFVFVWLVQTLKWITLILKT